MQQKIPKRIIQFWIGEDIRQPLRNKAMMTNVRLLNPDYEYLFFNSAQVEEFVDREFPHYRSVFNNFQYVIQRCDFFRYLAIYRYGGFYLDCDVLLASGLSGLLPNDCVFPFEALALGHFMRKTLGMDWQVGNYAFGATPSHPFIKAIINNCIKGQEDPGWVKPMMRGTPPLLGDEFFVINSTGPGMVSRTLAENAELARMVTVLFPDNVCNTSNWNHFGEYGIHLMNRSWQFQRSFVHEKVASYCWRQIQRNRVKESQKLGKSRSHCGRMLKNLESETTTGPRATTKS